MTFERLHHSLTWGVGLFLTLVSVSWAEVSIPKLGGPVLDQAGLYSSAERDALGRQLESYRSVAQIQIWTLPTLDGEAIESVSIRAVDSWKLGDQGKDNGILLLIALRDRTARIEVGRGLEGSIPDVIASRLIRQVLTPAFQRQAYAEGTQRVIETLHQLAAGELSAEALAKAPTRRRNLPAGVLLLVLIAAISLLSSLERRLGGPRLRRRHPGILSQGGFGGSHGGFGGFGGGNWSGGGGGFGGGGASGRW